MTDEPTTTTVHRTTTVHLNGPATCDIDFERIAQIIFDACPTSKMRAIEAADLIIDYLIETFLNAEIPS